MRERLLPRNDITWRGLYPYGLSSTMFALHSICGTRARPASNSRIAFRPNPGHQ